MENRPPILRHPLDEKPPKKLLILVGAWIGAGALGLALVHNSEKPKAVAVTTQPEALHCQAVDLRDWHGAEESPKILRFLASVLGVSRDRIAAGTGGDAVCDQAVPSDASGSVLEEVKNQQGPCVILGIEPKDPVNDPTAPSRRVTLFCAGEEPV